jgi:hypothetical protein
MSTFSNQSSSHTLCCGAAGTQCLTLTQNKGQSSRNTCWCQRFQIYKWLFSFENKKC